MTSAAAQYLQSKIGVNPTISSFYEKLYNYLEAKLWHQLTLTLETFVTSPEFEHGKELIELHQYFIANIAGKLNPRSLSKILITVSKQLPPSERVLFLREVLQMHTVSQDPLAVGLLRATIAGVLLEVALSVADKAERTTLIKEAKDHLKVADNLVNENVDAIDNVATASLYLANSILAKVNSEPQEFFSNTLKYLAYTPLETLRNTEKRKIAYELGIASLIGENVYNFGELLQHPILKTLEDSEDRWLGEILHAFSNGKRDEYNNLKSLYHSNIKNQSDLANNANRMEEKIAILSLLELAFSRPADNRIIDFGTISKVTQTPENEVELLVMKAQSLGLIKGVIDGVDQKVTITWVQPRILNLQQIIKMNARLNGWIENVKNALRLMENQTTSELIEPHHQ
eukprot:TRINITY_DN2912_c0_g1_i1.p1 TRINITY_DN2912_c0_g1~~TRINITY_DN2912_c0_g1_i1.p1  ORF type:complete len:401 (-),score=61.85 TRINITY_DN2912_c0_g1_i1:70-1272(-)